MTNQEGNTPNIEISNTDGMDYLTTIPKNSTDLILTDPPYMTSKETGMNSHYNKVRENKEKNIEFVKTEAEWQEYKKNIILLMILNVIIS